MLQKYLKYKTKYLKLKELIGGNKYLTSDIAGYNIYSMGAHACDTTQLLDVPDNCIYVTLGLCGDVTYGSTKFEELFSSGNELLHDPIKNLHKLQELLGNTLHIHYKDAPSEHMRKYLNCIYQPLLISEKNVHCKIGQSGLHRIGSKIEGFKRKINTSNITRENIEYMYSKSILPSVNQIEYEYDKINHDYDTIVNHFRKFDISQSQLFDMFPGIYYNTSCRVDCDNLSEFTLNPTKSSIHALRRSHSESGNSEELLNITSFFYYIKNGNIDKIIELIRENKIDFNEINEMRETPLLFCCENNMFDLAKLLIDHGADIYYIIPCKDEAACSPPYTIYDYYHYRFSQFPPTSDEYSLANKLKERHDFLQIPA